MEKGKYSYPYHYHHNSEELFVIIYGKGELRTPTGIEKVNIGEIVLFEKSKSGAHQIYNPNSEPLIYMDLRTINKVDVCEYPDSRKLIYYQNKIFTIKAT
ncbi:cupin domain-containing protein [Thiospirochaeta perfilievii]|uniref:cupin domain-containing protein n=1 Tax=Thiospirochaeta perfilievii TaxID=252967 RepID=UPI00165960BF|nr:cupin domain-containing protein [Thiospirochaeta perfilievii]